MSVQMAGVVQGSRIELERETGLPAGSRVIVQIEPAPLTLDERRCLVDTLCGSWAGDASLGPIFDELEQQRPAAQPHRRSLSRPDRSSASSPS